MEYLFRGKRLDNGEWVEGFLGQHTSLDAMIIDRPYPDTRGELSALNFWMVDPATVGMYTGEDAWEDYDNPSDNVNKVKIFKGDKVKFCTWDYNGADTLHTGAVYWCGAAFWIDCTETEGDDGIYSLGQALAEDDDMRVIGNIHDNAKPLEDTTCTG